MRVSGKTGFARLASPQCCPVRVQHILQLAPPVQVLAYMLAADPANKTGRVTSSLCNSRGHMFNEGIAAHLVWPPCGALQELRLTMTGLITGYSATQLAPFAKQLRVLHLRW